MLLLRSAILKTRTNRCHPPQKIGQSFPIYLGGHAGAHRENVLFVDKHLGCALLATFSSRFQRLKSFSEIDDLIQIVHSTGRVFLSEPIASLEDIAERE